MEFKTNHFFIILSKRFWIKFLILVATVLILSIIVGLTGMFNLNEKFEFINLYFSIVLIFLIISLIGFSKFQIIDNEIRFKKHITKDNEHKFSFIIKRPLKKRYVGYYTISNIEKIEYSNNFFENFFNVGHMKIYGSVLIKNKNGEPFEKFDVPKTYEFFGITKFKKSKVQIMEALPKTVHIEK